MGVEKEEIMREEIEEGFTCILRRAQKEKGVKMDVKMFVYWIVLHYFQHLFFFNAGQHANG